jgi:hypothetical protein
VSERWSSTPKHLRWRELSASTRAALYRKLAGLYGHDDDERAFDSLSIDKQQSLLVVMRRFGELSLWETVRRVEHVYAEGGVGLNFEAWPVLASMLRARSDFTARFSGHKDSSAGFMEKRRALASLHFLCVDEGRRRWGAHFDFYNPWSSPLNAWRHLWHEKIRHQAWDWRIIGTALWNGSEVPFDA